MVVRNYNEETDYATLVSWWKEQGLAPAWKALLPETTYIAEIDGVPVVAASLFLMNVPDAAMMENLIGNPSYKGKGRREAAQAVLAHAEGEARKRGYRTLVLFTAEDRLKDLYRGVGFQETLTNVTTFSKDIG